MRLVSIALLTIILAVSFNAQTDRSHDNEATRQLYSFFDEQWEKGLEENPTFASYLGDKRYNDKWGDNSVAAIEKRHKDDVAARGRLKAIDRSQLSASDRLNYDLYLKDLEAGIEAFKYLGHLTPLNQRGGIQTADGLARNLPFTTVKDYEDWIARLNAFPARMQNTIAVMREGIKQRSVLARKVLERVPAQIDVQIVDKPEDSPFYRPFRNFHDSIPEADRTRLKNSASEAIAENIIPQYMQFKKFFVEEYLPACYPDAGIWQHPQGGEYYSFLARRFTTTEMTPKEIHEKGLSEVKRIRGEMEKIREQVGFKGDLKAFFEHLRTDKQFFYETPEELLAGYRAISKRIDPEVVKVFRTLPRMPYGVVPIPDAIAPDTTTAYYNGPAADGSRAGSYYVNLYKPETRPKWEMMALSIHEAVPGHHLQIALQQELGEVPNFRKFGGYTAFTEGWGLYSESLGEEMGLYEDPYDKFGQLTYEMWRAVRLVVDTGIHYYKWDRQKAIDFFMDNAAKTEQDIVNEIDRYIAWPGQALAYKIGELKIKELRARATRELGDRFDLKEFHDVVLLSGAVPLDILERHVDEWVASKSEQ
ncbi:MAG: DUF885 domain-containing protein [Acidobacteria bacterium]|nr:MAG: DUF885 domain-containing protein [Acidobacteriota bacterium]REJ98695.1 MAG: DUF885 domain-containing protein [Acidobacteriota bacterium]REK16650.1 MAG: DUF885 domain-containing protein [Acidobacteriota bacterium]REK42561.1 MAG: DUF885 domain-containing protein [Acidobacteriota bacterium]